MGVQWVQSVQKERCYRSESRRRGVVGLLGGLGEWVKIEGGVRTPEGPCFQTRVCGSVYVCMCILV
jgi:hypothetical protein